MTNIPQANTGGSSNLAQAPRGTPGDELFAKLKIWTGMGVMLSRAGFQNSCTYIDHTYVRVYTYIYIILCITKGTPKPWPSKYLAKQRKWQIYTRRRRRGQ